MLRDFKIFRYPFLEAIPNEKFSLYGYNYLDVVTDGAINPANNFPETESIFHLIFENEDKLLINKEIHNFPIRRYNRAVLLYEKGLIGSRALQGGFGNLYVILKRYPITVFDPPKENPYISSCIDVACGGIGTGGKNFWIGKGRIDVGYELLIPYIPTKYKIIQYICQANPATFDIELSAYLIDDNNEADTKLIDLAANAQNEIKAYSTRYRLFLNNKEVETTKQFYIQLIWI